MDFTPQKKCSKCNIEKSLSDFYFDTKNKNFRADCKKCKYLLKDKIIYKSTHKAWRDENKEKIKEYKNNYRDKNLYKIRECNRKYIQRIRREDVKINILLRLRSRLLGVLKSQKTTKANKTMAYVGCSKEELRNHLSHNCVYCGSTSNLHIDHIKPLSKFDLRDDSQIYEAMNYKNLQILCRKCNLKKSNK